MKFPHLVFFALLALLLPAPASESPPDLPQPAVSFGATLSDGWLYIYGGNTGKAHEFHRESISGNFFRAKVSGGTEWEKLPGGQALLSSSLVSHGGKIIRIGGMGARNNKGEKNDLHSTEEVMSYDPATQRWEALPSLPEPRSSHDAVVVGDLIYVAGGWQLAGDDGDGAKATWHSTVLVLDLNALDRGWKASPQPFQRRAIAAVAEGGRIWFLGGMDNHETLSLAVDWFRPETGEWGKGPDLPKSPMSGFGMAGCALGNKVLASPLSGKIYALNQAATQWEEVARLTPARFFHRLLPVEEGLLVAVGGSNHDGHVRLVELIALKKESAASEPKKESPKPVLEAQWSQWRGPQRDGVSVEKGWRKDWPKEGPKALWRANAGVGMSSSVVMDGRLFTQGNDGQGNDCIVALDALTGAQLWKFAFPCKSAAHEMPIVPNGPGATPTVVDGQLFALSREGDLLCLAAATGDMVWRTQLISELGGKRPVYGYTQSPLIDHGLLIQDIGCEPGKTGSTVALDSASGKVKWRAGSGEAGYSSARVLERDGRHFVALFKGETLDLLDPADGRVLWSHRTTARDFCNALTPVFVGHRILVSNTGIDPAKLLDWDLGETPNVREVWSHKQFALLFNNPILTQGALFGFNEKRSGHVEFTCLDAATGESRWVSDAVPVGTFILADGHWIFLTRAGEVILAPSTLETLSVKAQFKALEGKCYATPTLASGVLYVRNNAGEIAAFDLRP
ncbi:MAG: Kelch repeat-containing protein [Chthoniobacteraceae bacterium]|nr:Kelch repeat-containing protein [Chthoniobacteraceae bacterium]